MNQRKFKDINSNEVITVEQLEKEMLYLIKDNAIEPQTIDQYINNCTSKNGQLIEIY